MNVVWNLGTGPECQLALAVHRGHRSMLLDCEVSISLVKEQILEDVVRRCQCLVHITELTRLAAVDIALLRMLVDADIRLLQDHLEGRAKVKS